MAVAVILASQSPSRREVLRAAGIAPMVRVSHVDEPATVTEAACELGVDEERLSVADRVTILARAKARAVAESCRAVAETARAARGDQVTAYPLRAVGVADAVRVDAENAHDEVESVHDEAEDLRGGADLSRTRDFSSLDMPTSVSPLGHDRGKGGQASVPGALSSSPVGPLVVGCDSLFLIDGQCQGKPHTPDAARERLRRMRSSSGELWTGHCVIDVATGRQVEAASRAVVRFGDYSDRDIDRYVSSGEPLEVAGSFTLEGLGGAFIDGIDGDPHGVMGISLPLLRRLFAELGVDWTDAWNLPSQESRESRGNHDAKGDRSCQCSTPQENVTQPGDGWVRCDCGRRHWGLNGAAGVLLARRDPESGEVTHVVMQHRALWSAEGGTWGIPGGAIADGESPIEGALRESQEEAGIAPESIDVVGTYREEHGPWAYTTVFAFEKPDHRVEPRATDDESLAVAWVPLEEVPDRPLLTAMRTDWPRFESRLRQLADSRVA